MAVDGQQFLDFAKKIFLSGDEISCRNCISRAYYAMYHEARDTLTAVPNFQQSPHDGLIKYLRGNASRGDEPFEKGKLRALAALLEQQKGKRHKADYYLGENIDAGAAEEAILFAEKLFKICKEMRSAPLK
ncbi:hypothetical protein P3S37_22595 [Enterobacter hormaechei]|uniref:hypothetical protein n=1 Tax=Enterobacter cloacae complex TaxID=354276 RepID=UPI0003BE1B76|nr:hypothetical protein [Enterobacter hormaechei]OAE45128.1 hypothetical protein A7J56_15375 [Enterobacter cloacae]EKV8158076.1 hypothetical protein [Enterobacter hormaechei subsp. xiangfangensis]EKV9560974.1 hypothetical protein [Enterobacter hormaechei]EKW7489886.1 hypothetical protein [Enterobacter hormaechei]ESL78754.1 hypothetical protein L422_03504 [Enterobacter hormaechei]